MRNPSLCMRGIPGARVWGKEAHALTFLGRVPVKHQPGEVEHSDEPAVGAERVHEDEAAGHSWWAGRWHTGQTLSSLGGPQSPLGKGSPSD